MADEAGPTAHRVTWFAPQRPVEGNTVFIRPANVMDPCICPLCGGEVAETVTYDVRRRELQVEHGDGISCSAAPVDQSGRYLS